MKTSDFDYHLPEELIAQVPIEPRTGSRLLVLDRSAGSIAHRRFPDIRDYLHSGDVLVFNDSLVIPARLSGKRAESGGKVEVLLLRQIEPCLWEALVKPGRRLREGARIELEGKDSSGKVTAVVEEVGDEGKRIVRFSDESLLPEIGEIPLPPYIHTPLGDPKRYQTVYAAVSGSVAAPTAGLHFTPELLDELSSRGIECHFTTLHVGLDTFRPVKEEDPEDHVIHREWGVVSADTAGAISRARDEGRRVICVGTTSVRLVEAAAQGNSGRIEPFEGWVDLFIMPGYEFRVVDAMVTNFHLPRSTLLMLVSAFAGKGNIDAAYRAAVEEKYRFYSFGDAMLIL